jgi:hypothetical protein
MADGPEASEALNELSKVSIYLDRRTDSYLESVRTQARAETPRVDTTRSAVVSLALNRLARELSPAEVVEELRSSAATDNRPGRKRP